MPKYVDKSKLSVELINKLIEEGVRFYVRSEEESALLSRGDVDGDSDEVWLCGDEQ